MLRAERTAHNLTQQQLAFEAQLSLTYIGEIERGERMISLDTLFRLAGGLKTSPAELIAKVVACATTEEEKNEWRSEPVVTPPNTPSILIAEDDRNDLSLVRHFLNLAGVKRPIVAVNDGEELIELLRPLCENGSAPPAIKPCVLFLDINMPKVDGFTALEWIRMQPALKELPVVALSSAIEPADIKRAAKLGVARFMTKYPRPQVFAEIIESMCGSV